MNNGHKTSSVYKKVTYLSKPGDCGGKREFDQ